MAGIDGDWLPAIGAEFKKPYYRDLFYFVKDEYAKHVVYPPSDKIFTALHLTPLHSVKAVILGQDPYHEPHQAMGMAFSVEDGVTIPPSLVNIFRELHDDLGCSMPKSGNLTKFSLCGNIRRSPIRIMAGSSSQTRLSKRSMSRIGRLYSCCGVRLRSRKHSFYRIRIT